MKQKKDTICEIEKAVALSLLVTLGIVSYNKFLAPNINNNKDIKRFEDVDTSVFKKNNNGDPLFLPTKNGRINLNIEHCFNEEQLAVIKESITHLDYTAKGLEYKYTTKKGNYISITEFTPELESEYSNAFGLAKIKYTKNSMRISYPITIYLNTDLIGCFSTETYGLVVQHELMHALGFADLYSSNDTDQIMYYQCLGNEISDKEKEILNTVYDKKHTGLVSTSLPTEVMYIPSNEEEDILEF